MTITSVPKIALNTSGATTPQLSSAPSNDPGKTPLWPTGSTGRFVTPAEKLKAELAKLVRIHYLP